MVTLKGATAPKENTGRPRNPAKNCKAKFTVFGEELIEKEVGPGGNAGRVYLPLGWVGKLVKIIRTD